MEYGMEKIEAQWVVRNSPRGQIRHFGEPESPKAVCGVTLWTAQAASATSKIPCCARCLANMKQTVQKLTLEIVSFYFARGKSWTEEQVAQFENYQDMHLWLTQEILKADTSYQPLSWVEQIGQYQRARAEREQEVAHG